MRVFKQGVGCDQPLDRQPEYLLAQETGREGGDKEQMM